MERTSKETVQTLSIYPKKTGGEKYYEEFDNMYQSRGSFGVSVMSLVSEVREKYSNTVRKIQNFKDYATSTEGKIKFGVMAVGLSSGFYLAYRSPSKRLYYKRLLPVGTLTIAASLCYPYQAYEVSKTFARLSYKTTVGVYTSSKKVYSYISDKLESKEIPNNKYADKKETTYVVDERGIINVSDEQGSCSIDNEEETKKSESASQQDSGGIPLKSTTIFKILPDLSTAVAKVEEASSYKDYGQGSPEDASLYTTRS